LKPHVFYGASECGGVSFDRDGSAAARGSVGTLLPGVTIEVQPEDDGSKPDAGGATLTISSPAVADRYHPDPDPQRLSAGRFVSDDLVRYAGHELYLVGRRSSWINVRGRKVSPREVERVLTELDGVDEAVVLGLPSTHDGQAVKAFLVAPGANHSYMDILEFCRDRLAPYKIPRAVSFVQSLPRTARGKLDRRALEEM
ncbi:MAG: class I adenylate-forming enzyme family protein, partial [Planctomycetota bacterium]